MKTIASILAVACAMPMLAAGHFTISGTIPGVTDSIRVTLYNAERNDLEKIVETVTTDGQFSISETVKMPTLCQLSVARKGRDGRFRRVNAPRIMVENTDMTVNFTQPLDSLGNSYVPEDLVDVKGGMAQNQFAEYLKACGGAELKSKLAGYKNAEKWFETSNNPDTMAIYDRLKAEAASELLKVQRDFIASHPQYHISAILTFKELQNIFTYTDAELDAMAEQVKVCPDTARVSLNNRALAWSKQYSMDRRYPDFAVDDTYGVAKQFSTYVTPGKYTFIDFWASWCGPCRAAIPHVRNLREQYGDKLNVYSISCDENEAAWRKAMEQEKMEWPQLRLNPSQIGEASKLYAISAIPRLILLDQHGRIVCSTNLPKEIDAYLEANVK